MKEGNIIVLVIMNTFPPWDIFNQKCFHKALMLSTTYFHMAWATPTPFLVSMASIVMKEGNVCALPNLYTCQV